MTDKDPKFEQFEGKAKEEIGKITGDKELEVEGKAENLGGKIKEGFDDAGKVVKGIFNKDENKA